MSDHTTSELADVDAGVDEDMPPIHPLADRMDPGGWDRPGHCICGAPLPPKREWHDPGRDWAHILCTACGTLYVDEETYLAIYDTTDPQYPDLEDESCQACLVLRAQAPAPLAQGGRPGG